LQPTLPEAVDDFLTVALAKNPDHRYQSASAMMKDLAKLSRGEEITTQIPLTKIPRRKVMIGAAIGAVVLIAGSFLLRGGEASVISVPNVVGLTENEARALLDDFTITIQRAPDQRIPKDRIAAQLPVATARVEKGSAITLTISDGAGDTTVPAEIVGKSLEEARALLSAAGLRVLRTIPVDSELSPGSVISVSPSAGSTLPAGSAVTLEIASGNVKVPNLIGASEIQARTTLTQAGFLVRIVEASDPAQPEGIVLAQAPQAGETKTLGSYVTVTINRPGEAPTPEDETTP
jgi:serine/threonine-protein kinase